MVSVLSFVPVAWAGFVKRRAICDSGRRNETMVRGAETTLVVGVNSTRTSTLSNPCRRPHRQVDWDRKTCFSAYCLSLKEYRRQRIVAMWWLGMDEESSIGEWSRYVRFSGEIVSRRRIA